MENFPLSAPAFDGKSRTVEAGNAFEWFRQGWVIFAAYPGPWIALTVVMLMLLFGMHIVPVIGSLAAYLLTPMLGAGILLACQKASNGEEPQIPDLFAGFNRNSSALIMLGVLYMAAMLGILLLSFLVGGGGMIGGLASHHPLGLGLAFGGLIVAMLLSLVLLVPLCMAMWFAPALVLFNNMPPVDALKASFNACMKNVLPFLVYGLVSLVLLFFAALPLFLGFLVLVPVLSGSVYASYRDIFLAD